MMGRIGYRVALAAIVCALALAAPARAGEPGKDAEALAKQKAAEAAKKRALERARAEELAKRKAAAAAAAAAAEKKDDRLRPRFKEGGKTVEAVKGGKTVWKVTTTFPVGGVIVERNFWHIFSKDEKMLQRVYATNGKVIYRTRFRVQNKAQAVKLVDQYLASLKPVKVTPEINAKVASLVKQLGSREFSARDAASKELAKIGKAALPALRAATKSKDLEVAERAQAAIEVVEGSEAVTALRSLGWSTKLIIYKRKVAASRAGAKCAAGLAAAEKAGKKEEAAKLKARLAAARKLLTDLEGLEKKVSGQGAAGVLPVFGVQGLLR